ncbi:MAG: InlB B-repeat-containing protein [Spirochaetales bacterium]|nr:InlB B-repeat-containing protein [Spirochaetales bacterium]
MKKQKAPLQSSRFAWFLMIGAIGAALLSCNLFINYYTVIYDANGADSGTVPTDSNRYRQGAVVMVQSNNGNLAKTGYSFAGWNTKADGSGTTYQGGSTFTMGEENVILYAQWSALAQTVDAGAAHTMILKADGTLWATGDNYFGQLGDATTTYRHIPVQVMTGVQAVAAGGLHTMILKTDGTLWATGNNKSGQLGDGTTINRYTPVQITF